MSRTRHLVNPELLPMLEAWPTRDITAETLPDARNMPGMPANPKDIARSELTIHAIPGPKNAPDVSVSFYRPKPAAGILPAILHIHGGGYVMGSAAMMESVLRPLCADLGCAIVSVDYRLAPETPAPGSVEDCYAALAWMMSNAGTLGIDSSRIGVMGESAGGGLAAALALLARDRGAYRLAFQHLIYPMLDDRTCTQADLHPHTGEFIWTAESNRFGWSCLLGAEPGGPNVSPYAAPARATSLEGLPDTYIATGGLDLFLEEDIEYGRRLMRAGVPVELHVYPGAFHAFDMMPGADVSGRAVRDSRSALKRALHPA